MNPNKEGAVRLTLDTELRAAVDAVRKRRRLTATGYVRDLVIRDLVTEGLLQGGAR